MNSLTDHGLMWIYSLPQSREKHLGRNSATNPNCSKNRGCTDLSLCNLQTRSPKLNWGLFFWTCNIPHIPSYPRLVQTLHCSSTVLSFLVSRKNTHVGQNLATAPAKLRSVVPLGSFIGSHLHHGNKGLAIFLKMVRSAGVSPTSDVKQKTHLKKHGMLNMISL